MWLGRLLLLIVILALLPLLQRIVTAFFRALLGRQPSRPRAGCARCGGSGWITAGAGMKKACGCGSVPPEGRGPIIDIGRDERTAGR